MSGNVNAHFADDVAAVVVDGSVDCILLLQAAVAARSVVARLPVLTLTACVCVVQAIEEGLA